MKIKKYQFIFFYKKSGSVRREFIAKTRTEAHKLAAKLLKKRSDIFSRFEVNDDSSKIYQKGKTMKSSKIQQLKNDFQRGTVTPVDYLYRLKSLGESEGHLMAQLQMFVNVGSISFATEQRIKRNLFKTEEEKNKVSKKHDVMLIVACAIFSAIMVFIFANTLR